MVGGAREGLGRGLSAETARGWNQCHRQPHPSCCGTHKEATLYLPQTKVPAVQLGLILGGCTEEQLKVWTQHQAFWV